MRIFVSRACLRLITDRSLSMFLNNSKDLVMATGEAVTQFFNAVKNNEINTVVELLKNKAVEVDTKDPTCYDQTALHIASDSGYEDLARILVDEFNASVNIQDEDGKIPLQIATDVHNINIVKFLLERNSDLKDYAKSFLNEPIVDELFEAAEANNIPKVIELVKEKKVNVNSLDRSNNNRTILHVAATKGYMELVRVLVDELHANIQYHDDFGETAKNNARINEHLEIVQFFKERGYKERIYGEESDFSDDDEEDDD